MTNQKTLASIIDFPVVVTDPRNGRSKIVREKERPDIHETEWTNKLLVAYDFWRDLVDLPLAVTIQAETTLRPGSNTEPLRGTGFCRADAIITHVDGRITIIESKVSGDPNLICGGIGQLIYYKTLAENFWGVEVAALVLAARHLPEFVADSIANIKAPIRFLKASDDGSFYGLVPDYGNTQ